MISDQHLLVAGLYFVFAELIAFGASWARTGFYLDDWGMVQQLSSAHSEFLPRLLNYYLHDPKIIIRPVEALYFSVLYAIFDRNQFGYHLFNACMEVMCAVVFYFITWRACDSKCIAFIAAIILLLFPIHDSTHYWVVASSLTFSLLLSLSSAAAFQHSAIYRETGTFFKIVSYVCFALSALNYECFIGFFANNLLLYLASKKQEISLRLLFFESLPFLAIIGATFFYGHICAPTIANAWVHQVRFDPSAMASIIFKGLEISLGPESFVVASKYVLAEQWSLNLSSGLLLLSVVAAGLIISLFFKANDQAMLPRKLVFIALAGIFSNVLSYSVFSLNSEYMPTLTTLVNRVNYGAALGSGLCFAVFFVSIIQLRRWLGSLCLSSFISFCLLSNWTYARPWIVSWEWQKHVIRLIDHNRKDVRSGKSVILLACPRYLLWVPVFDGVWDFQNMLRVVLDENQIRGGVVTDRLQMSAEALTDESVGVLCQSYPWVQMKVLLANQSRVVDINSPVDFLELVKTDGLCFGLNPRLIQKWEEQSKERKLHRNSSI